VFSRISGVACWDAFAQQKSVAGDRAKYADARRRARVDPDRRILHQTRRVRNERHPGQWLNDPAWAAVPFVGLTATPWTRGLGKHFHKLIIAATTQELIDAEGKVFVPDLMKL
jgi:hypothetical protein